MAAKKEEKAQGSQIRTLLASEIECRVGTMKQNGCSLLLYKDARVDMRMLDEVYGPNNWQRSHELINGNLFCTISVWDTDKGVWVNKQDVGTESNTEKEKGQASDAFKRAAFNWGIGRELYTAPFIWITLDSSEVYEKTGYNGSKSFGTNAKFNVQSIEYNQQREISKLVIVDGRGDVRYVFGEVKEKVKEQAPARTVPKNPAQAPPAFTGAQLTQAVDEMNACKSRAQVLSVWKRYTVMQNNNEFRNACIEMGKKYPEKK